MIILSKNTIASSGNMQKPEFNYPKVHQKLVFQASKSSKYWLYHPEVLQNEKTLSPENPDIEISLKLFFQSLENLWTSLFVRNLEPNCYKLNVL
jgi:hypothetical protein